MRIHTFLFALSICSLVGCAASKSQVPASLVGGQTIILGDLGRPVGTELTIQGHILPREPMRNGCSFAVDSVDGRKLRHPTIILVRGAYEWPDNIEVTMTGYEIGVVQFGYEVINDPLDQQQRQVMNLTFQPSNIIDPENLKIGNTRW